MSISLNEIRSRAIAFSVEWDKEVNERAEAKSFWDGFFNVFGVSRRRVAAFEERVHKSDDKEGYIDLLWKGTVLVEHKSRGKNLDRAYEQAKDYFPGISENNLPRYIIVCDFARFRLYDLDESQQYEFTLRQLPDHIHLFGFMSGHQKQLYPPQDPVNIKAAESMGILHDQLKASNYTGHDLEVYLVRLLFCLFSDSTGIFGKNAFREYIDTKTKEDGSDLGSSIEELFQVLNTPEDRRSTYLDEDLRTFPYVNGGLFKERIRIASFDSKMRMQILEIASMDWGRISPAIFGSLFQSVKDAKERREFGAHYTEEKNILKVVKSLFLDELYTDFENSKNSHKRLEQLQEKMSKLRFLDPACGCGNFLVITYRELRLLELEILKITQKGQQVFDAKHLLKLDVDQFYGFEIDEFPSQIAQVALWLTDHQMNNLVSFTFGETVARLPLTKSPNIQQLNALRIDWNEALGSQKMSYILGNPPFVGSKLMTSSQREDMRHIFKSTEEYGILDYVSAWYLKASRYIENTQCKVAFVSTKSITQGEQVGVLWEPLLNKYSIKIHFAHRTFKWTSEARGKAAIHCVIIGFAQILPSKCFLFDYETPDSEPSKFEANHINPYLADAPDVLLFNRKKPIDDVPLAGIGNKPIDNGNYLFTDEEKNDFIKKEPNSEKYFRLWIGADEFINGYHRYCLWLGNAEPEELRSMPEVMKRIESVREYRLASKSKPTQKLSESPTRFHVENIPNNTFIVIPETSSELREYVPIGFLSPSVLAFEP